MSKQEINIQDAFLFHCMKNKVDLHVELLSGRSMECRVKRFDRFVVLLEFAEKEVLVYKHAIASIETPFTGT